MRLIIQFLEHNQDAVRPSRKGERMKRILMSFTLLTLMLAACAPQFPMDEPTPTDVPADLTAAQSAALSTLSDALSLPADEITLVSTEAVTWPDGCLGVQRAGVMCTQALVEGFRIILEVGGKQYELRTNETGSQVVFAEGNDVSGLVEKAVISQLAGNLGLDESDISLVSSSDVEFGDACLGVAMQDVMCAQVITPGKIVMLEAGGVQYEYHTSVDGSLIQPATLALTWKREGGFAGFCDSMTVFLSGEIYGNQCKSQPNETMGIFANLLSGTEQKQFASWVNDYRQVDLDASDPEGVSDRMVVTLVLFGNGSKQPADAEKEALFNWAQNLFRKLYN
jgi:hypothetical protein